MGFILSKFWKKKKSTLDILEKIESDITEIQKYKQDNQAQERKILHNIITYGVAIFLVAALVAYFQFWRRAKNVNEKLLILLPFLLYIPILHFVRRLITWNYHRKNRNNDQGLKKLQDKKSKILEEVMEKETYKVAKEILEKYDPSKLTQPAGVGRGVRPNTALSPSNRAPQTRPGPPDLRQRRPGTPNTSVQQQSGALLPAVQPPGSRPPATTPVTMSPVDPASRDRLPLVLQGRGAQGPPLPRPVLPREKGVLDKFVDYLVGDGPSNRYALICRQCQSHNGMALREEFEYIAYRCCYCYYWNPARRQRPVAPRLPDPGSQTRTSDTEDSSRSSSEAGSRRSSQVLGELATSQEELSSEAEAGGENVEAVRDDDDDENRDSKEATDDVKIVHDDVEAVHVEVPGDMEILDSVTDCNEDSENTEVNQHTEIQELLHSGEKEDKDSIDEVKENIEATEPPIDTAERRTDEEVDGDHVKKVEQINESVRSCSDAELLLNPSGAPKLEQFSEDTEEAMEIDNTI